MFTHIHHVGLVVSDIEEAKRLWVDTFGFKVDESRSPLPQGRHVDLDGVNILDIPVGEAELEINMPTNAESGTGRYLARRGQGPHHLCLYSDDIDGDVRRLQDGGLQLVVPPTGSPDQKGGPRVAFFHPRGNLGFLLELWQNMPTNGQPPQPPRGRGGALSHFYHVGFVAPSLEEGRHLFCDIYGLKVNEARSPLPEGRFSPSDNIRALHISIGESEIEVIVPQDPASGTSRFLASHGPGIHHVCFYSEDFDHDMQRLRDAGLQEIGTPRPATPGEQRAGWFHPRSNMGLLVEIIQEAPTA